MLASGGAKVVAGSSLVPLEAVVFVTAIVEGGAGVVVLTPGVAVPSL